MVMAAVPKKRRRGWLMSSDIAFSLVEWRPAWTLDDDRPRPHLAAPATRRLVESSVYCCKASWIERHVITQRRTITPPRGAHRMAPICRSPRTWRFAGRPIRRNACAAKREDFDRPRARMCGPSHLDPRIPDLRPSP